MTNYVRRRPPPPAPAPAPETKMRRRSIDDDYPEATDQTGWDRVYSAMSSKRTIAQMLEHPAWFNGKTDQEFDDIQLMLAALREARERMKRIESCEPRAYEEVVSLLAKWRGEGL